MMQADTLEQKVSNGVLASVQGHHIWDLALNTVKKGVFFIRLAFTLYSALP